LNKPEGVQELYSLFDQITEDIVVVVNNSNVGYTGLFETTPVDMMMLMMNVNACTTLFVSHYFVPKMLERYRTTGKRSAILNITLGYTLTGYPTLTPYIATKAFIWMFSKGLHKEY
jgi:short-subunit dehydrogenase